MASKSIALSMILLLLIPARGSSAEISAPLTSDHPIYRELRWADNLGLLSMPLPGHRPLSRKAVFELLKPTRVLPASGENLARGMRVRLEQAGNDLVPWEAFWKKGPYPVMVGGGLLETLSLQVSSLSGGDVAPEPWNYGELYEDGLRVQGQGSLFLEGDWLSLSFAYRLYGSGHENISLRPLVLQARSGWKNVRLTVGREPLWWSPSDRSALLLSDNARPLDQVRLESDTPWHTPIGWLNAVTFLAHLDDPDRADYNNPWVAGMRASWAPFPWFVLGATRTIMLGGEGNPFVVTWESLWDLLVVGNENRKDPTNITNDTNQLGSVEASLYLWPLLRHVPVLQGGRVYAERGGEDSPQGKHFNAVLPSAPGLTIGLELVAAGVFLRGEASNNVDDSNLWYWHRRYRDGFVYRDRILGHAMGGDAHAYSLEAEIPLRGGRDMATLGWFQWDRGHQALPDRPPAWVEGPVPNGIQDLFVVQYEYGHGAYPGCLGLEARYRNHRGDRDLFGDQEEWGITLFWRR